MTDVFKMAEILLFFSKSYSESTNKADLLLFMYS
jgi:hypothetical protein